MDPNSPLFTIFDKAFAAFSAGELEGVSFDPIGPTDLINAEHAITALVVSSGNIGSAALKLQMRRTRLRDWIDTNPEVQVCLNDMRETKMDNVEDMQFAAALAGDAPSGRFLLQTLGKERGFIQRVEQTGKDGKPLNPPSVDYSKMSIDTLRELREAMRQE